MSSSNRQRSLAWWIIAGAAVVLALAGLLGCTLLRRPAPAPPATETRPPAPTDRAAEGTSPTPGATHSPSAPPTLSPTPVPTTAQPTATQPLPAATEPPSPSGIVNRALVDVREGPGIGYAIVAQARSGEQVSLLGRSPAYSWLYVRLWSGQLGWIENASVTRAAHLPLPVIDPEATPVPPGSTPPARPTPCEC